MTRGLVRKDIITSLRKQILFTIFLVSETCERFLNALKSVAIYDVTSSECSRCLYKNISKIKVKPKKQLYHPNFCETQGVFLLKIIWMTPFSEFPLFSLKHVTALKFEIHKGWNTWINLSLFIRVFLRVSLSEI